MKLLADECCDAGLVEALRHDDHDILYVVESMPGAADHEVLNVAFDENRIVMAEDKDFGELVFRLQRPVRGLVLIRFSSQEADRKIHHLRSLLERHSDRLYGTFVVLEPEKVRMRELL